MPTIRKAERRKASWDTQNHIVIERVHRGFQTSGVSTVNNYTRHLSSSVLPTYESALREATAWCVEYGIPEIFVVGDIGADET